MAHRRTAEPHDDTTGSGSTLLALLATLVVAQLALTGWLVGRAPTAALGLGVAIAAAQALAALWLHRRVLVPVRRVAEQAAALAAGDLTVGAATERIRQAVQTMVDSGSSLNGSASQLAEVSSRMEHSFEQTMVQATSASSAAEQVSHRVTVVSSASAELNSSVSEIARSAQEAAAVAEEAVSVVRQTNELVQRLDASSAEIGNVVRLITSITEQTNLLALNATIEAARAGEAGKGFAVVAGEVKELAHETARATEDITRRIDAIQSDSRQAADAIGRIGEVIDRIAAHQVTIAGAVDQQSATTSEISRNLAEAAAGSADIASGVAGLATVVQDALSQLASTRGAAAELASLGGALRAAVDQFQLPQPEMIEHQVGPAGGVAFEVPGVVSVSLLPRTRSVLTRWLRYDDFAVKPALTKQLELTRQHRLTSVIVDSQEAVGAYSPEMSRWIGQDFVPLMQDTPVRLLVTVVPRSALTNMANQEWQSGGEQVGLRMVDVGSMAEAERLCASVAAGSAA
jgi:methyl-accepting chemotaxis protein